VNEIEEPETGAEDRRDHHRECHGRGDQIGNPQRRGNGRGADNGLGQGVSRGGARSNLAKLIAAGGNAKPQAKP